MKYFLHKKETGSKAARFHYTIKDETGAIISDRKSNREYVAATINGQFYFGRIDLIGKGDHGKTVKFAEAKNPDTLDGVKNIAYLVNDGQ